MNFFLIKCFRYAGSLEEALNSQKYYSDYFSTTEAEKEMIAAEELASSSKKVVRRKKKIFTKPMNKTMENSDSDEAENRGSYFTSFLSH